MFKFIHTADIHLDSPLLRLEQYEGAPVEKLRNATRRAFENLVNLALSQRVDFVLISGDLYDGDWRDYNTGLFLVGQLAKLRDQGIRVFLITGNHDAASVMTRSLRLPDNTFMFPSDKPDSKTLEDIGVAIHGQGFASRAVTKDLSREYPVSIPGYFNIGMLHTCATGREGHETYAPCTPEGLLTKGYDYWALGHVHQREILEENPLIVFPGNIQGRSILETGPKGCMLVSSDDSDRPSVHFHALEVVRWEKIALEMKDYPLISDPYHLIDEIADKLQLLLEEAHGSALAARIEICGCTTMHSAFSADPQRWINEIRRAALDVGSGEIWVEKVGFFTNPKRKRSSLELNESTSEVGPVGETLHCLKTLRSDPVMIETLQSELADLLKKLPLELKRDEDDLTIDDPSKLSTLFDQVEPLLLNRLLDRQKSGEES